MGGTSPISHIQGILKDVCLCSIDKFCAEFSDSHWRQEGQTVGDGCYVEHLDFEW